MTGGSAKGALAAGATGFDALAGAGALAGFATLPAVLGFNFATAFSSAAGGLATGPAALGLAGLVSAAAVSSAFSALSTGFSGTSGMDTSLART